MEEARTSKSGIRQPGRLASIVLQIAVLFAFWLVLSGHYDAEFIIYGLLSAVLVTFFSNSFFYSVLYEGAFGKSGTGSILKQIWRFSIFVPWLFSSIMIANVQVAYFALHPKMPISPGLLVFRTGMKTGMAQVTLANSITVCPGTITASMDNGVYVVHALKRSLASELEDGTMENRIARIYLEEKEPPPSTQWRQSLEEMSD